MGFLLAKDAISGKEGMLWATVDGQVRECAEVRNITVTMDKTKSEFRALGQRGTQHKATGYSGTGSMTVYYVTSFWNKMLIDYAKTGVDTYFTLVFKNEDPNSAIGAQKVKIDNVNLDGGDILKLDVDAEYLDQSFNFTWTGIDTIEEFKPYNVAQ